MDVSVCLAHRWSLITAINTPVLRCTTRKTDAHRLVCYDGPFWDDARLHHGDVTGVLEIECRRSTVGGSVVVRVARDFGACVIGQLSIVCAYFLLLIALLFANLSPERIKRFLKDRP
ncbi:hypothetical protein T11_11314 [Trichinella zimbabwensis]|uniref:Uncharacterized protein n=1 Tax=Trichinella zimbabwensis TaxID=268475 RepID=A0A0V1GV17_9BILA|nr:hypothetical protein T11_11314 [Trichinella zimbabwensis]